MELGLKGRVALLTAAGSGLGKACASALAAEGAHVVISDVRQEALDKTTAEIAAQITFSASGRTSPAMRTSRSWWMRR
jgi:3-oxoacyl-[acyl-carrier protein] reductase